MRGQWLDVGFVLTGELMIERKDMRDVMGGGVCLVLTGLFVTAYLTLEVVGVVDCVDVSAYFLIGETPLSTTDT